MTGARLMKLTLTAICLLVVANVVFILQEHTRRLPDAKNTNNKTPQPPQEASQSPREIRRNGHLQGIRAEVMYLNVQYPDGHWDIVTPLMVNESRVPIKRARLREFFAYRKEGFGAADSNTRLMNRVGLITSEHFDAFCSIVELQDYPMRLMLRFSHFNPVQFLTAAHLEILRNGVKRPTNEKELVRYEIQATKLFGVYFEIISNAVAELDFPNDEIWNAGICGNHEMRDLFRDYVVLENHLFSWLMPSLRSFADDPSCVFSFLDTSEIVSSTHIDFYAPFSNFSFKEDVCQERLSYLSPVWYLWNKTLSTKASKRICSEITLCLRIICSPG
eukprot:TRINITY_DN80535_c0_g1_i1.p2 TRINITY_DN80535_c0_g1~~TRINITY_DN80535_c0_g1_i1.p2  ORF type:complete len:353 (-),score=67.36 TRINITY_DN80535_c0_g1_i1:1231-2226(-)